MCTKLCLISLLSVLWLAAPLLSEAAVHRNVDTASAQDIIDGMATKGVRGVANILTGWVEFPKQIYITGKQDGWGRGTVIGPLKGIGMTVVRTVCGAGELFTFFLAYPGYYDPWLEPKYVWLPE